LPLIHIPTDVRVRAVELAHESSAWVIIAACTDGRYYVKGLSGLEGNQMLLCEWIGTQLANEFGLQTLHYGIMHDPIAPGEGPIYLKNQSHLRTDAVFASRPEPGLAWEGGQEMLALVGNRSAFARLVVFDTWVRNFDRHVQRGSIPHQNQGNVFISTDAKRGKKRQLLAIDHTHILGDEVRLLQGEASKHVFDRAIYGLFAEFIPYIKAADLKKAVDDLRNIPHQKIFDLVSSTPSCWGMTDAVARSLSAFLLARARHVAQIGYKTIMDVVGSH
jgi:hypothetical protein